jgi:hypothetical protein
MSSLSSWSMFWEISEYASEAIVCLGCIGEYVAEYTEWSTSEARHSLGRRSLIVLILGLAAGLLSLIKTNNLSGVEIESLGQRFTRVSKAAKLAGDSADSATLKATHANNTSDGALIGANKAEGTASNALTIARGARKEADSFEKDIKSAKRDAGEAKALLSEVRQLAADAKAQATQASNKVSDRTLSPAQQSNIANRLRRLDRGELM